MGRAYMRPPLSNKILSFTMQSVIIVLLAGELYNFVCDVYGGTGHAPEANSYDVIVPNGT